MSTAIPCTKGIKKRREKRQTSVAVLSGKLCGGSVKTGQTLGIIRSDSSLKYRVEVAVEHM